MIPASDAESIPRFIVHNKDFDFANLVIKRLPA
jgi:hypothetical protein